MSLGAAIRCRLTPWNWLTSFAAQRVCARLRRSNVMSSSISMARADAAKNISFVAYSDQGGRPDGVQVIVHKGFAYVGHMFSDGFSVLDVRDPRKPEAVAFVPMPRNTRSHHLQVADDLLLAINGPSIWTLAQFQDQSKYFASTLTTSFKDSELAFAAGVRIYDISVP